MTILATPFNETGNVFTRVSVLPRNLIEYCMTAINTPSDPEL